MLGRGEISAQVMSTYQEIRELCKTIVVLSKENEKRFPLMDKRTRIVDGSLASSIKGYRETISENASIDGETLSIDGEDSSTPNEDVSI